MIHQPKLMIASWDGATYDLILPWIKAGLLPNIARLMNRGASTDLESTIPPKTAAAWTTFMTGVNPAKHGVYDFIDYRPDQYNFVDHSFTMGSSACIGRTIFDLVGKQDQRSLVLNLPMTYPVWPINGVMLAGPPCPDKADKHLYPANGKTSAWLERSLFKASHFRDATLNRSRFLRRSLAIVPERTKLALDIMASEPFDVVMVHYDETDRAAHYFWKDMPDSPAAYEPLRETEFATALQQHYIACDEALGEYLAAVDLETTTVIVVSDHGFGPSPTHYFHINAWLSDHGFLRSRELNLSTSSQKMLISPFMRFAQRYMSVKDRSSLRNKLPGFMRRRVANVTRNTQAIDWTQTNAYLFPMATPPYEGIVVNVEGRQPKGSVPPAALEEVKANIISAMYQWRDSLSGEPVVKRIMRREEIYSGEALEKAPDLILELTADFVAGTEVEGSLTTPIEIEKLRSFSGNHRPQGILVMAGPGVAAQEGVQYLGANIRDMAPTLLALAGCPIPDYMEGHPLQELLAPELKISHVPGTFDDSATKSEGTAWQADEEQDIVDRLRGLGYIE